MCIFILWFLGRGSYRKRADDLASVSRLRWRFELLRSNNSPAMRRYWCKSVSCCFRSCVSSGSTAWWNVRRRDNMFDRTRTLRASITSLGDRWKPSPRLAMQSNARTCFRTSNLLKKYIWNNWKNFEIGNIAFFNFCKIGIKLIKGYVTQSINSRYKCTL